MEDEIKGGRAANFTQQEVDLLATLVLEFGPGILSVKTNDTVKPKGKKKKPDVSKLQIDNEWKKITITFNASPVAVEPRSQKTLFTRLGNIKKKLSQMSTF